MASRIAIESLMHMAVKILIPYCVRLLKYFLSLFASFLHTSRYGRKVVSDKSLAAVMLFFIIFPLFFLLPSEEENEGIDRREAVDGEP